MSKIDALVTDFVTNLRQAIAEEAAAAFAAAATGSTTAPRRGRPSKARGATPLKAPRRKSGKRTPEQVEAQAKSLLEVIKKTPGQNIESLGKTLGVSTRELALPVLKLWDQKAIRTSGIRRGTRYFPK